MTDRHSHIRSDRPWPFPGPDNEAVFSCSHVIERSLSILRVTHDHDDGAWQFLCGGEHETEDARVVCIGCIIGRDATLAELGDLPEGWCAERELVGNPWARTPNVPIAED
jgi:hypothetical protein